MLDQLVESKSNSAENTRRSRFLVTVFVLMSHDLDERHGSTVFSPRITEWAATSLSLTTLVAPVPVRGEPPPKPEEQPDKKAPERGCPQRDHPEHDGIAESAG